MDDSDGQERLKASSFAARADRGAFSDLFQGAFRVLWLIARSRVDNRVLAEDVLQEAAVIALGKFDQYEQGTNFAAWMGQFVRHVAQNMARKEGRRRTLSIDVHPTAPELLDQTNPATGVRPVLTADGELALDQSHFDDEVLEALRGLSETARACLLLRTIEGMDYEGISELLHVPRGTAMSHVHRAREVLRARLTGIGYGQAARGASRP